MSLGPYPDFAWSHSRHRKLERCARRYYYSVYGAWNGWEEDAPAEARAAYRLKQLAGLERALGTALHRRAHELVEASRSGRDLPPARDLRQQSRQELARLWRRERADFVADPKNSPMLLHHYYGREPDEEVLERLRRKLDRCHPHLRGLELWRRIREREDYVVHVEDPDGPFTSPEVEVDGVDVFARPDLVVQELDGDELTVVEWKTGEPREEDRDQVAVYGLWVRETLGDEGCTARIHYLLDGSVREEEITPAVLEEAGGRVAEGIEAMRHYVADPSVNRPREKEAFPLTDDRWECYRCPFFELCEAELRAEGPLPWEAGGG